MTQTIKSLGIVGAGTMGIGISQVAALAGIKVILFDASEEQLASAVNRLQKSLQKGVEK